MHTYYIILHTTCRKFAVCRYQYNVSSILDVVFQQISTFVELSVAFFWGDYSGALSIVFTKIRAHKQRPQKVREMLKFVEKHGLMTNVYVGT